MNREQQSGMAKASLLAPVAVSATGTSKYADLQGFDAATLLISVGDLGSVDGSNLLTFEVQEADDTPASASSYSQVAAADLAGDVDGNGEIVVDGAGDESKVYAVAYRGSKRYVRVVYTETGTVSGPVSIEVVAQLASREPASELEITTGAVS